MKVVGHEILFCTDCEDMTLNTTLKWNKGLSGLKSSRAEFSGSEVFFVVQRLLWPELKPF